jgi:hypothetical protein
MRNMLVFLLLMSMPCGAGLSCAQTAKTSPELPQFSIAISTTNEPRKAGSSIVIEVALTNVSGRTIGLAAEAGRDESRWYTVDVRRQDGSIVLAAPRRPSSQPLPPGAVKVDVYSAVMVELRPGETRKEEVVISDLFDMSRPGKYSVQVTCKGAKSNTITMTVGS